MAPRRGGLVFGQLQRQPVAREGVVRILHQRLFQELAAGLFVFRGHRRALSLAEVSAKYLDMVCGVAPGFSPACAALKGGAWSFYIWTLRPSLMLGAQPRVAVSQVAQALLPALSPLLEKCRNSRRGAQPGVSRNDQGRRGDSSMGAKSIAAHRENRESHGCARHAPAARR